MTPRTQYIKDDHGKNIAVVLSIKDYKKMVEAIEDIEDVRLYDEAKNDDDEGIPIEEAFKILEARKNKG
jgi:hypothetical protein